MLLFFWCFNLVVEVTVNISDIVGKCNITDMGAILSLFVVVVVDDADDNAVIVVVVAVRYEFCFYS